MSVGYQSPAHIKHMGYEFGRLSISLSMLELPPNRRVALQLFQEYLFAVQYAPFSRSSISLNRVIVFQPRCRTSISRKHRSRRKDHPKLSPVNPISLIVQSSKLTLLSIISMARTGYRRNSKRSTSTLKIEAWNAFHPMIGLTPRHLISCFSGDLRMLRSPISPSAL